VPVAARTAEVLADLGVGVRHQDAFAEFEGETFEIKGEESSSH
jgi:hypothetical protein